MHAPQLLVSHPITVPVFPSFSRRYCTSSIRGSTSSETCAPSTVRLILVIEALPFAHSGSVVRVTLGVAGWRKVACRSRRQWQRPSTP